MPGGIVELGLLIRLVDSIAVDTFALSSYRTKVCDHFEVPGLDCHKTAAP